MGMIYTTPLPYCWAIVFSIVSLFYIIMSSAEASYIKPSLFTTSHHNHHPSVVRSTSKIDVTTPSLPSNGRKRNHDSALCVGGESGEDNIDRSTTPKRRPSRRNSQQQSSSRNPRNNRRTKTGLSNMCSALGGPIGAPQLPVLTTRDPRIIERWLDEHVNSKKGSESEYTLLGFDSETIAKPPWQPERASLPNGPATVQLSTTSSCIIVQLALCGDGSATYAPEILRSALNNPHIIKVGVGIDDDALDLYRWSKESYSDEQQHDSNMLWAMKSRLDIGCILPESSRRAGLRELAQKILGVELIKSKKLAMSNWGKRDLTLNEISYAARDAWVSVAIVEQLQKSSNAFNPESLMNEEFMKSQRSMDVIDTRAKIRKTAKLELKEIAERQKLLDKSNGEGEGEDERKQELYKILDTYRADQPPSFSETEITLQSF